MLKMSEKAGDYCSNEPLCVCTCARVCVFTVGGRPGDCISLAKRRCTDFVGAAR